MSSYLIPFLVITYTLLAMIIVVLILGKKGKEEDASIKRKKNIGKETVKVSYKNVDSSFYDRVVKPIVDKLNNSEKYGENAVPLPCDGLMELVERENMAGAEAYLERLFSSWDMGTVAAVVLGCTHYVFLKPMIREMLPADIILTEGNEGTARQLKRVLEQRELLNPAEKGRVIFHTSGDAETVIPVMERLYERAKKL